MKLTPQQASCIATIRAYGHLKSPVEAWTGWMRHLGVAGPDPNMPPRASAILRERAPRGTDPLDIRIERLKEKGLHLYAAAFTDLRQANWGATPKAPVDIVGFSPDDFVGQCAMLYQLSRLVPYATLAYAFSVPYSELGERLLIGEQLELCHDEVDAMARNAIRRER